MSHQPETRLACLREAIARYPHNHPQEQIVIAAAYADFVDCGTTIGVLGVPKKLADAREAQPATLDITPV